jgi:hypothetical protein
MTICWYRVMVLMVDSDGFGAGGSRFQVDKNLCLHLCLWLACGRVPVHIYMRVYAYVVHSRRHSIRVKFVNITCSTV